jgi:hypothetical protein
VRALFTKDPAWKWPLRVFLILVFVVIAGTVLALLFGGCASQAATDGQSGYRLVEQSVVTTSGETITCIVYPGVALECDWGSR